MSASAVESTDVTNNVEGATPDSGDSAASSEPKLLGKAAILALRQREYKTIAVKAWGGQLVRIQSMTASERDQFEDSVQKTDRAGQTRTDLRNARAKLCVLTIVDENGKRLFAEEDVKSFGQLHAAAVNEIFEETSKLSGILKRDIEELVGNSAATDTSDS